MPLLDDLLRSGGELLDDKGGEWFDKATAAARDELPAVVELASSAGVEVTEDQAAELLNEAAKGKAPILRLGSVGFAWVVAHLESDDEAEARRRYLEHQATFEERRAAMHAAGDRAQDDGEERAAAWAEFTAFVQSVGKVGLQILIAVARKAVGI